MAGSTWPALLAGRKARGSEVEAKFDWIEGSIAPMSGGNMTDNVYDLGTTTARWAKVYTLEVNAGSANLVLEGADGIIRDSGSNVLFWNANGLGYGVNPGTRQGFHAHATGTISYIRVTNSTTGNGTADGGYMAQQGNVLIFHNQENDKMEFLVNDSVESTDSAMVLHAGAIRIPRVTTTKRDNSITAENGMILYNTTTGKFNFRENSDWKTIGGQGSYFRVGLNSSFSATASLSTKVPYDFEFSDSDGTYDNVTNYRFTPSVTGKYIIHASLYDSSNRFVGADRLSIYKNGSELSAYNPNVTISTMIISSIVTVNTITDYFEIFIFAGINHTPNANTTRAFFEGIFIDEL